MFAPESSSIFDNFLLSRYGTTIEALRVNQKEKNGNYDVARNSKSFGEAIYSLRYIVCGAFVLSLLFKSFFLSAYCLVIGIGGIVYRQILIRRVVEAEKCGTGCITEEGVTYMFYDLEKTLSKILGTNVHALTELPVEEVRSICSDLLKRRAREIISLEKDGARPIVIAQARSTFRAEHKVMSDLGLASGEWDPYFK